MVASEFKQKKSKQKRRPRKKSAHDDGDDDDTSVKWRSVISFPLFFRHWRPKTQQSEHEDGKINAPIKRSETINLN